MNKSELARRLFPAAEHKLTLAVGEGMQYNPAEFILRQASRLQELPDHKNLQMIYEGYENHSTWHYSCESAANGKPGISHDEVVQMACRSCQNE